MSSLNLILPDELNEFVEAETANGEFASVSEYLQALIRDARKRKAKQALDLKLLEGLQGPTIEMTREDWKSIEREALEGLSGETIRP